MNNQSEKARTKQTATYSFRNMTDWCRQNIHDLSIQKFVKEFQFKEKSKAYAIFLNILKSADLAQLSQIQEQIDAFKTWKTTSEADLFWEHVSYSSQRQITDVACRKNASSVIQSYTTVEADCMINALVKSGQPDSTSRDEVDDFFVSTENALKFLTKFM